MHSYWDDFWALTGYKDAVEIAQSLGKPDAAARIAQSRDQFRGDLLASIAQAVKTHAIDFIPGCAELGDFDATSTTVALTPAGEQEGLPQGLLRNTFERYWQNFSRALPTRPGSTTRLMSGARSAVSSAWVGATAHRRRSISFSARVPDLPDGINGRKS